MFDSGQNDGKSRNKRRGFRRRTRNPQVFVGGARGVVTSGVCTCIYINVKYKYVYRNCQSGFGPDASDAVGVSVRGGGCSRRISAICSRGEPLSARIWLRTGIGAFARGRRGFVGPRRKRTTTGRLTADFRCSKAAPEKRDVSKIAFQKS